MSGALKIVRERIVSVKSTQQITKAMKMVSAAKLKRAQDAITQMRPYADRLNKMLINILSNLEGGINSPLAAERDIQKVAIAVVTSSKGLAGAFNTNIIKAAVAKINTDYAEVRANGNLDIICVGKKSYDYFRKEYSDCNIIDDYVDLFSNLDYKNLAKVSQMLMDEFASGNYDRIDVSYSKFKNAALQFAQCVQYLPVENMESTKAEDEAKGKNFKADYIFEPGKEELLDHLIPSILQTTFQKYLYDTHASEHGARMTAMDNATENAEELMKELKISYNKARQEAITKELAEIVGGAAALGG